MSVLSLSERRELEEFLRVFVGDRAFAQIVPIQDEPLMAVIFRGLTYDHGVVSGNYVGSGFSVSDWLILSEVHYNKRSPSDLARLMRVGRATLSLRLKSLSTRGLMRSERDGHDGRRYLLSLTKQGMQALHGIESRGTAYFDKALSPITDRTRLEAGITIFTKYVHALKSSLLLTARLEVMSEVEICQARRALGSTISMLGPGYPFSGYLLHERNFIGRIVASGVVSVIVECVRDTTSRLRLVNLFTENGSALPYSFNEIAEVLLNSVQKTLHADAIWSSYIESSLGKRGETYPSRESGGSG
jgi:DNA-binding MarR family transcriptional regulator